MKTHHWRALVTVVTALVLTLVLGLLASKVRNDLSVARNDVRLLVRDTSFPSVSQPLLKLAIISDLHVGDTEVAYANLSELVAEVLASKPDFTLLLGDYTQSHDSVEHLTEHRKKVAEILGELATFPTVAVLGNYENWSDPMRWDEVLSDTGIKVLENEIVQLDTEYHSVCFRGLGDAFTRRFSYLDFPSTCSDRMKITLTHDPAGAFDPRVEGLIFAGHTHCGQVRLPLIGSIWVPSAAPRDATCGLYQDERRVLWVSSGVGHSILPIRIGAESQWDVVLISESSN
jgi:uncharacterized protein